MLEPYANRPPSAGETFWQPDEFAELDHRARARGWSCHVHGTGDRGLRVALDGFEARAPRTARRGARHGMVHTECLHADDVPRFGALGVAPIMQPRHCAPAIVAGLARQRRGRPVAVRMGVPVAARQRRLTRVLERLERRRDGPAGRHLHRDDPRRPATGPAPGSPRRPSTSRPRSARTRWAAHTSRPPTIDAARSRPASRPTCVGARAGICSRRPRPDPGASSTCT